MQASKSKSQFPAKAIARPIAHLLRPVQELPVIHVASHLPKADTSINKDVASVAVTGYN